MLLITLYIEDMILDSNDALRSHFGFKPNLQSTHLLHDLIPARPHDLQSTLILSRWPLIILSVASKHTPVRPMSSTIEPISLQWRSRFWVDSTLQYHRGDTLFHRRLSN